MSKIKIFVRLHIPPLPELGNIWGGESSPSRQVSRPSVHRVVPAKGKPE